MLYDKRAASLKDKLVAQAEQDARSSLAAAKKSKERSKAIKSNKDEKNEKKTKK